MYKHTYTCCYCCQRAATNPPKLPVHTFVGYILHFNAERVREMTENAEDDKR